VYDQQGNIPQAIIELTKTIERNPNYADAYFNRAANYAQEKDFDKAWTDVHKAEGLGYVVNPGFISLLKEQSGKEK